MVNSANLTSCQWKNLGEESLRLTH